MFDTAALSAPELIVLASFAVVVRATDEARRWWLRRLHGERSGTPMVRGFPGVQTRAVTDDAEGRARDN